MSLLEQTWEGWTKLRRFYLSHFRKSYARRMQDLRQGDCKRCGMCCTFMIRCPHLEGINQCTVYDERAQQCRLFPIDARDLRRRFSACGYHFVTKKEAAADVSACSSGQRP